MLKFLKRLFWCVPSVLWSLIFFGYFLGLATFDLSSHRFLSIGFLVVFIVSVLCYIGQLIYEIVDVLTKQKQFKTSEKVIWIVLLWIYGPIMVPCYYLMHMEKRPKSFAKYSFIPYIFLHLVCWVGVLCILLFAPIKKYTTLNGEVQASFRFNWSIETMYDGSAFDLYAGTDEMYTGMILYNLDEYSDYTKEELFEFHIEDIQNIRENVRLKRAKRVEHYDGKTVTSIHYTGNMEGESDPILYVISMVEFANNPNLVTIVIQTSSVIDNWFYDQELEEIVHSITLKKGSGSIDLF